MKNTAFYQIVASKNGTKIRLSLDPSVDAFVLSSHLRREGYTIEDLTPLYTMHTSVYEAMKTANLACN